LSVYALGDRIPRIAEGAYIHPEAVIIGNVTVEEKSTVWPSAVLRGDYGAIVIGAGTSIQDGAVIHATEEDATVIGDDCVIGHLAHLEGCEVRSGALVGSGAIVLARAVIAEGALVAAAALVGEGVAVPRDSVAIGVPARIRPISDAARGLVPRYADLYVCNGMRYAEELRRIQ
jgi:carbonic anhydrase/acetyltransferase-like protein (isoleucine patch superfamily)